MEYTPTSPQRIVCLTEETTEMLYILGEQDRIVGISGFTVRPPEARREKPRVSAFTSAKIDSIVELDPDLVLGFSDLQGGIALDLVRKGLNVHVFNQRSVKEILDMIVMLGSMVNARQRAEVWIEQVRIKIAEISVENAIRTTRPRVYFEEWDDPMISGIRWVSELIEIAGGQDCFQELSYSALARDRIIADPVEVIRRVPDIIIGSWCGKKFQPESVVARLGWEEIPAVRNNRVYEIKAPYILQPGPAALTEGLDQLHAIIKDWYRTV